MSLQIYNKSLKNSKNLALFYQIGRASAYFHRDSLCFHAIFPDMQTHDTGFRIKGFLLVENEVAYAVINLVTMKIFDGLQGVGMMTHQHIGTCHNEHVGIVALEWNWC